MFLTINDKSVVKEYSQQEFIKKFDLRIVYFSSLYNEETREVSDLHVDFLARWYEFDPQLLLKFHVTERYKHLDDIGVMGLLSFGKDIVQDGFCEEYSCGHESIAYTDFFFLYSENMILKKRL